MGSVSAAAVTAAAIAAAAAVATAIVVFPDIGDADGIPIRPSIQSILRNPDVRSRNNCMLFAGVIV